MPRIGRVSEKILTSEKSFVTRNKVPYYGTISVSRWNAIVRAIGSVGSSFIERDNKPMERKTAQSKPNNLVQTIERVSLILEMVGQNSRGTSIRDLSAGLNLPKGTIHRILSSLSYFGYIRQDAATKIYFLGLKLMDLNAQLSNQLDFRKVAEPVLRDLAEKTKQTAHLVVLDRDEVVYVDKIETQQQAGGLKMASRVGSRNPIHSSAVGKVLLSYFPEEAWEDFLQRKGLPRRTANTITDPDGFRAHLKIVRNQGYAMDDEENEKGIRCLGAPIFDGNGRAVAAISVSGSVFQVTKKAVHDVLKGEVMAAAAEISRRLGFQDGQSERKI
jgi:DNA-binding IclR family transcriptional regulator